VGSIRVHEFMSLDGVIDAPTWTFDYGFDPQMGEAIGRFTEECDAILLGRTTYEMFEPAWSTRTVEDDPGAPFFNDTRKYVVSSTLEAATWKNSTVLGPYDPEAIRRLKDETNGIYMSGSGTLVRALIADGLIDELHLFVFPLTRGTGPRLFEEGAPTTKWSLTTTESYPNGVLYVSYRFEPSTA
jgi:dihydrofolate reductase